ncbi:hypothetical protein [Streptantibioticus parmotrematis]|nr:hypothetical protein [Streptantibioticus parmotrematis]
MVELTVSPDSIGLSTEVAFFHDIRDGCGFPGRLHPEIQRHDAPA